MRKVFGALVVLLLFTGLPCAQTVPEGLGEFARKVRMERAKKDLSHVPYYTNDNIPKAAGIISVVGAEPPSVEGTEGAATAEGQAGTAKKEEQPKCDESCWRGKFSAKRAQISTAQAELDVLQREYNLARTQYYQDPNRAVREQYSNNPAGGGELGALQQRINDKKAAIERLQRELSDLEDALRRAGGNPAWARE